MSATLITPAMAEADYGFSGLHAPHGIGEPFKRDAGCAAPWSLLALRTNTPGGTARFASHAAEMAAYDRRRAMHAARMIESARVAALHAVTDETPAHRPAAVTPLANEWRGVPLRTITALADDGWTTCDWIASHLEASYARRRRETQGYVALMASEPQRDGRGTAPLSVDTATRRVARAEGVNGTEVRAAERWTATPANHVTHADGTPIDTTCYRLIPPAHGIGPVQRVPFVPPVKTDETDNTTTREITAQQASEDRLLAIVGVVAAADYDG